MRWPEGFRQEVEAGLQNDPAKDQGKGFQVEILKCGWVEKVSKAVAEKLGERRVGKERDKAGRAHGSQIRKAS